MVSLLHVLKSARASSFSLSSIPSLCFSLCKLFHCSFLVHVLVKKIFYACDRHTRIESRHHQWDQKTLHHFPPTILNLFRLVFLI
jgi:hypothetical protein